MNDYSRALDAQAELAEWWAENPGIGSQWVSQWVYDKGPTRSPTSNSATDQIANLQSALLRRAPSYFVTGDMTALTEAAARVMPPEPFLPSDPTTDEGFVFFDRSFAINSPTPDLTTLPYPARAFCWWMFATTEGASGTSVVLYAEKNVVLAFASDGLMSEMTWRWHMPALVPVRLFTFEDRQPLENANVDFGPIVKAFWTISQQRIAHVQLARPDRATTRRLERAQLPVSDIRVVTLRRRDTRVEADGEHAPVEWSHRWLVSGHWRNQYLPSVDAHRLQWIAPYEKGPEDRPLIVKKNVFRVAR